MKKILAAFLVSISLNVYGQKHYLGIEGGVNLTNATPDYSYVLNAKRVGFTGGFTYDYLLLPWLSLGTGIIYQTRGHSEQDYSYDMNGHWQGYAGETQIKYNYLNAPVKVGFNVGKKFYIFGDIGVVPALLLNAKALHYDFDSLEGPVLTDTWNDKPYIKMFDLAPMFDFGFGYKFKTKYWIFAKYAYQKSITDYIKEDDAFDENMKHHGRAVTIGIKYGL